VSNRDHRAVGQATLQELGCTARHGLTLGLGIGAAGSHDCVGQLELFAQAGLELEAQPGRGRNADVHDA
jgi:hypothetical protein